MDVAISTLTPLRFLQRSEDVWADRPAVRDGDRLWTYSAHGERVRRAAGALRDALGIADGDRVATLLPNVAAMLELHYAVPGAGGVLVPLNTRLAADDYAYILGHAEPRVVVAHPSRREVLEQALARMDGDAPQVIWDDGEYDALLAAAEPAELRHPADERALISINYTSGTTGRPKGVMTTHRGAYLHALGVIAEAALTARSRYVWTLPMFHCNGWAYPWAVTATGARHLCLAEIDAGEIWRMLLREGGTHLCAAPTLITMLVGAPGGGAHARARPGLRRRRAAGAVAARARRRAQPPRHPSLRADRVLRADRGVRLEPGLGRPVRLAAGASARQAGREHRGERADARRRRRDARRPPRRRGARRGRAARRQRHDRLLPRPGGDARRRSAAGGSTPATSASCTPTATSSCATA